MDRGEFEAYREHRARAGLVISWTNLVLALAIGYALGLVWSLLVGALVTVALVAAGRQAHIWWERTRWLRRFPELADDPNLRWERRGR